LTNFALTGAMLPVPRFNWTYRSVPYRAGGARHVIKKWQMAAKPPNGGEASPPQPPQPPIVPLADAALVTKLRIQQSRMLVINDLLLDAIPQAITVAPLNQQVTALSQMTDRVIKLATELPQPPEEIDYEGYLPPLEQPTPEEAGPAPAASQPTAPPHRNQLPILLSDSRYRVVACGRRFGKTEIGKHAILRAFLRGGTCWWLAPTYPMAESVWADLQRLTTSLPGIHVQRSQRTLRIPNGGVLSIKSTHEPDHLRGAGLDFVVLDEAAFMAPAVWPEVPRRLAGSRPAHAARPPGAGAHALLAQRPQLVLPGAPDGCAEAPLLAGFPLHHC